MNVNRFDSCVDVLSLVLFELYIEEKLNIDDFSLFSEWNELNHYDDWFKMREEFLASLSPEDYREYCEEQQVQTEMMWEYYRQ